MRKRKLTILVLNILWVFHLNALEYGSDENVYMLVSRDQHTHTPRLEDFFWTGSGDGPPPPDPPSPSMLEPSTPIVLTTTVLATVYLDSYPSQAVTDKTTGECILNCEEPMIPSSLTPDIPEDRRYWLLTVIQGSTPDSLQLKLARLYQKAFLRQQERHLGIIKSLDAPTSRKKHEVHSFLVNKDNNIEISPSAIKPQDIEASIFSVDQVNVNKNRSETNINWARIVMADLINEDTDTSTYRNIEPSLEIRPTNLNDIESWILATATVLLKKREISEEEWKEHVKEEITDREEIEEIKEDLSDMPIEVDESNETLLFKREIIKPEQQPPVEVFIQNVTEVTETGTVQIVYVVTVGGRPVPAAVAARDMRLVRDAEVAKELGAVVTTKAEPAYLKAAEGLEGRASEVTGIHGTELLALTIGAIAAILLVIVLLVLLCLTQRRKAKKSAASMRAYRNELMREVAMKQMKQVHDEKDGKLISVVSPSRTRPSSSLLPVYRAASASSSTSSTTSDVSEINAALRRRQKKPHALRMPQKKRVGTTDSLLESAGIESSDSGQASPITPTSYLSMPSVNSFPRGNIVEPLSRILEPISVRHLDVSPISSPKDKSVIKDIIPRRQMSSQLIRLGSIDKDPGVVGPLVWDLHCQRMKDSSKQSTPSKSKPGTSRMRQRFNELMDDAFTLFGSAGSSHGSQETYNVQKNGAKHDEVNITQARNENVRLPGSPYSAIDTIRGRSAGVSKPSTSTAEVEVRPRTSFARPALDRRPPAHAWVNTPPHSLTSSRLPPQPTVNTAIILAKGKLPPEDPAVPLISAIKTEIQRVREQAQKSTQFSD